MSSSSTDLNHASTSTAHLTPEPQQRDASLKSWLVSARESERFDKFVGNYGLDIASPVATSSTTNAMRFLRSIQKTSPELLLLKQENGQLFLPLTEDPFRGRKPLSSDSVPSSAASSPSRSRSTRGGDAS